MEKFTQKQLRALIEYGVAIDLTHATSHADAKLENGDCLTQIGYVTGRYGCNGKLLRSNKTGQLYVIAARTQSIYLF